MSNYIIGDTIRLKATIKNLAGVEEAPVSIKVSVLQLDGTVVLAATVPSLTAGTTAQYYFDWLVDTVNETTKLIALWEWTGHKKKMTFDVIPTY